MEEKDWVNSLERDAEILEGQIMMAKATGCDKIAVPVDSVKRIWARISKPDLESQVISAAIKFRCHGFYCLDDSNGKEFADAVDRLLAEREGHG